MKRSSILKRVGLAAALVVLLAASPGSVLRAGAAETFNADFQETFVGFSTSPSCPTGLVHLNGTGAATYLGKAREDVWGCTVPIPGTLCHSITDTRTLSSDDGSGTLDMMGVGIGCPIPSTNPQQFVANFTWSVTGGTGTMTGASGSGANVSTFATGPAGFVLDHYSGALSFNQ